MRMPPLAGPVTAWWRWRTLELVIVLNTIIYAVPLVVGTFVTGNEAWGVPELTGPRRVAHFYDEEHALHCTPFDAEAFVRAAPEAYTSLLFFTVASVVFALALEHDFGVGTSDAPLPATPTVALVLSLAARGTAGFLAHASARVDYEVADRAAEWPLVVVLVGLFEQRLLVAPLKRPHIMRTAWLAGVALVSAGFVLAQVLGDTANGVRTETWPDAFLRIGPPALLGLIPFLLLLRLVLECVQCYGYHAEQRLLPLLVAGVFLFSAFFFADTKAFALFTGECEVDGKPVPGWRRTHGWSHAAYAVGAFAAWYWVFFERTQRGAPELVQLVVRRAAAAAAAEATPFVSLPSRPASRKEVQI